MKNKKNQINNNEEILKSLPNGFLYKMIEVLNGISFAIIFCKDKPYYSDFVTPEYFKRVDIESTLKILDKLDTEFNIIDFRRRQNGPNFMIGLKNKEDKNDFINFIELVKKIYKGQDRIRKITFVNPEEKRFKVIINGDYTDEIIGDYNKSYWKLLSLLAQNKKCYKIDYTSAYDQLNNKDKTPFKGNYEFSPILQVIDGEILPRDIKFEKITDKQYRDMKDKLEIDLKK